MDASPNALYELRLPALKAHKATKIVEKPRDTGLRVGSFPKAVETDASRHLFAFSPKKVLGQLYNSHSVCGVEEQRLAVEPTRAVSTGQNGIIKAVGELGGRTALKNSKRTRASRPKALQPHERWRLPDCRDYRFENKVNLMLHFNRLSFKVNDILTKFDDEY